MKWFTANYFIYNTRNPDLSSTQLKCFCNYSLNVSNPPVDGVRSKTLCFVSVCVVQLQAVDL